MTLLFCAFGKNSFESGEILSAHFWLRPEAALCKKLLRAGRNLFI
jgi:hypothetical protein